MVSLSQRLTAAAIDHTMTMMPRLATFLTTAFLAVSQAHSFAPKTSTTTAFTRTPTSLSAANNGVGIIVRATIEPDRMSDFVELIETNAVNSRKERGCLRFDVLRSQDVPNEFFFYELYTDVKAIDAHKETAHYALWADFKTGGGVIESVSYKTDAEFLS